jgi:hypothetical protein
MTAQECRLEVLRIMFPHQCMRDAADPTVVIQKVEKVANYVMQGPLDQASKTPAKAT